MSTEYHIPVVAGSAGTVASVNTPLSSLDGGLVGLRNGSNDLKGLTLSGTATSVALASDTLALPATATRPYYMLSAQSGTSDDLSSITGGYAGRVIVLQATFGHVIRVKYGAFINLGSPEIILSGYKTLTLICGNGLVWREMGNYGLPMYMENNTTIQTQPTVYLVPGYSIKTDYVGNTTQMQSSRLAYTPSGDARSSFAVRCQGTTTHVSGVTVTASGTPTATNDDIDVFNNYASAASAGALAGVASANFTQWRLNHYPVFAGRIQTSADLTTQRLYIGLSAAAAPNSDTLAASFVGLRYSSVAGDPGFMLVSYNGSQVLGSAITGSVDVSKIYDFRMVCTPTQVTIKVTVDGVDNLGIITALPSASADLGFVCNLVASAAAARSLKVARLYGEHGGGF